MEGNAVDLADFARGTPPEFRRMIGNVEGQRMGFAGLEVAAGRTAWLDLASHRRFPENLRE